MFKGEMIYIDAVKSDDLPQLMAWRNLPEYRKYFREYRELNMDMQRKWYESRVLNDNATEMFAIRYGRVNWLLRFMLHQLGT